MMTEEELDALIETVTVMDAIGFPSMKNELKPLKFIKGQNKGVQ